MKKLTKLQKENIDENISKNGYVCFPVDIFKSKEYKQWRKNNETKHQRKVF